MQKKQLRTLAIIALVAIFVIGSIMRLTIEPADLGKGEANPPSQIVENLPSDGDVTGGNGENTDNVGGDEEENNSEDVSGGDTTAVSDGEKSEQENQPQGDDKANTSKTDTSKTDTAKTDTAKTDSSKTDSSGNGATDITDDSAATKPDSSAESGSKPGAWPPIPAQTVADPNNPQTYHCTMEIYCTTLLNEENIDNEAIIPYIPEDGVILPKTTIEFTEGENAFDVILRACRQNDIQFEFREDSLYSGAYVEGINYLYEFDGGPLSGWMYKVNGQFPNYGCKRYIVQDGDAIVWMYTCDLGRDVGDNSVW